MKKLKRFLPSKPGLGQTLFAGLTLVLRFGFLPPNVSGVGAVGFASSSILPLIITTVGFDLIKGGFYSGFWWTYTGFFGYWIFGRLAEKSIKKRLALLPLASLLFFALSNFGVWLSWYPHTLQGLLTCYTLALPFYRNTLIGDLVFGSVAIAAMHLLSSKNISLANWKPKLIKND